MKHLPLLLTLLVITSCTTEKNLPVYEHLSPSVLQSAEHLTADTFDLGQEFKLASRMRKYNDSIILIFNDEVKVVMGAADEACNP